MATNFFENQDHARRMTNRLVFLYTLAVIAIVSSIGAVAHFAYQSQVRLEYTHQTGWTQPAVNYQIGAFAAGAALLVILGGMLVRIWQLGSRGETVALLLGGIPLVPNTTDPDERRLMNVVEEMSIASGIPVPRVFILPNEMSINAFAAGLRPTEAVIGVTKGTLTKLNRDELQGVVAHEFSHIFNGDMRLNLRLMGVLGGILALATIGRVLLESMGRGNRRSSSKNNGAAPILFLGIGLLVIGYIGVFFANLIKAAVSRQREFLADASAVQYTRNPVGIGGALKKIATDFEGASVKSAYANEASHMFFGSVRNFSSFFATHPPLDERIRKIDPRLLIEGAVIPSPSSIPGEGTPKTSHTVSAMNLLGTVGAFGAADVVRAREFIDHLPEIVREASRTAEGAKSLVLALLMNESKASDGAQKLHSLVRVELGEGTLQNTLEIRKHLTGVLENSRLSLIELLMPALRLLPEDEKVKFLPLLRDIVRADGDYAVFEFVALSLIARQLRGPSRRPAREPKGRLSSAANEVAILLSAVSYAGSRTEGEFTAAYNSARLKLSDLSVSSEILPPSGCTPEKLESSLGLLRQLRAQDQKMLIEACVRAIVTDQKVKPAEMDLLRAVCAVLEAPMPALS